MMPVAARMIAMAAAAIHFALPGFTDSSVVISINTAKHGRQHSIREGWSIMKQKKAAAAVITAADAMFRLTSFFHNAFFEESVTLSIGSDERTEAAKSEASSAGLTGPFVIGDMRPDLSSPEVPRGLRSLSCGFRSFNF